MPSKCEICEKEFKSDGALAQHYKAKHPDAKPRKSSMTNAFPRRRNKRRGSSPRRNLVIIASVVLIILVISLGAIFFTYRRSGVTSSPTTLSDVSASTSLNFAPTCMTLNQVGGVRVTGSLSPSSPVDVKSATLWWRYHNSENTWYPLNDLMLGSRFSSYGNFSHTWNPPSVNYYDFEVNWTLSSGQVISAITSNPLQVVAQGTPCPS